MIRGSGQRFGSIMTDAQGCSGLERRSPSPILAQPPSRLGAFSRCRGLRHNPEHGHTSPVKQRGEVCRFVVPLHTGDGAWLRVAGETPTGAPGGEGGSPPVRRRSRQNQARGGSLQLRPGLPQGRWATLQRSSKVDLAALGYILGAVRDHGAVPAGRLDPSKSVV